MVTAYLTGKGGVGTYKLSGTQVSAGTNELLTASTSGGSAVVSFVASWSTTNAILTVSAVRDKQYVNRKRTVLGSWDASTSYGCACDSSWSVGLGPEETQQSEFFGAACEFRRCPTGDDPLTWWDETDGYGKSALGSTTLLGAPGNKYHHDCSGRGVCDYTTGDCTCFEGWRGTNCNISESWPGNFESRTTSTAF